jgi:hypothetical protein
MRLENSGDRETRAQPTIASSNHAYIDVAREMVGGAKCRLRGKTRESRRGKIQAADTKVSRGYTKHDKKDKFLLVRFLPSGEFF